MVHNISDPLFHYDFLPHAYDIDNLDIENPGNDSHAKVEWGIESFYNAARLIPSYRTPDVDWSFLPTDAILQAYGTMFANGVTWSYYNNPDDLSIGWDLFQIATAGSDSFLAVGFPYYVSPPAEYTSPNILI